MTGLINLADFRPNRHRVTFNRAELQEILNIYSRRVAKGEWRDYAIDMSGGAAMFSIFRSSYELPLYNIVKRATTRQTDFVLMSRGQKLRQERNLGDLLAYLDARSLSLVR
ncbi:DUF2794 domain-containing protein [Elstera sp.]|jgi:hypothetical protein|uniref:DUF2794 domain-containing protein n=1 Tax=Elstera sp. TaxID=1916664 RepID=UPI0037C0AE2A